MTDPQQQAALRQASFCLRELLPNHPDAQMTVRMIESALAASAPDHFVDVNKMVPEGFKLVPEHDPLYSTRRDAQRWRHLRDDGSDGRGGLLMLVHAVHAGEVLPRITCEAVDYDKAIDDALAAFPSVAEAGGTIKEDLIVDQAQEDADTRASMDRMADLLTRTANALRGDPGPLRRWSWHDLPERAAEATKAQTPVAWRWRPSPHWSEHIIAQDPNRAEEAKTYGMKVEALVVIKEAGNGS